MQRIRLNSLGSSDLPGCSYADVCIAPDSANPAIALGRVLEGHSAGLSTRAAVLKSRYDPCKSLCRDAEHCVVLRRVDDHWALCLKAWWGMHSYEATLRLNTLYFVNLLGVDNEVEIYFNREDVQDALHVNPGLAPKKWKTCRPGIEYSRSGLLFLL